MLHAWVEVERVSIKTSEGVFVDLELTPPLVGDLPVGPDEEGPPVQALPDGALRIDLLALRNGIDAELAAGALPPGRYSEIRLLIGTTDLVMEDPTTGTRIVRDFKIPSGSSSGLKVKVDPPFVVAATDTTHLVLDFDLAQSFRVAGLGGAPTCGDLVEGEGKVMYAPTIRPVNKQNSGILEGFVMRPETVSNPDTQTRFATLEAAPGVDVFVTLAGDPDKGIVAQSTTEGTSADGTPSPFGDGYFSFFLETGEYDVYLESTDGIPAAEGVFVVPGEVSTLQLELGVAP